MPLALVLEHPKELGPSRVRYMVGQAMVSEHTPHVQVLDGYDLVLVNQPSAELVIYPIAKARGLTFQRDALSSANG